MENKQDNEKNAFSSVNGTGEKKNDGFVKPDLGENPDISDIYVKPNFQEITESSEPEATKNAVGDSGARSSGDKDAADNSDKKESDDVPKEENNASHNGAQNGGAGNGSAYNGGYGNGNGNAYGGGYGNGNGNFYGGYGGYGGSGNGQYYGNYRGGNGYGQYGGYRPPSPKKKNNWFTPIAIVLCIIMCLGSFALVRMFTPPSVDPGNNEGSSGDTSGTENGSGNNGAAAGSGDKSPFLGNGEVALEPLPKESEYYTIPTVVENTRNTVVEIVTESKATGSIWGQYVTTGAGSGVIISSYPDKGTSGLCGTYIITNEHVISGAFSIKVKLTDGREYNAELVAADVQTDIAVIHIDEVSLPVAQFADSNGLRAGETVIVIGNPLGSLGGSVSSGIVSCTERNIEIGDNVMKLIQTTAAVNPGNSGGAMFDLSGKLVGVVNAKYSAEEIEGIGFAIPGNVASAVASDIMNYGYVKGRPNHGLDFYYGICTYGMVPVSYNGERIDGLWAETVAEGSDTQKVGLEAWDQIVSVSGPDSNVYTFSSVSQAKSFFDSLKVGEEIIIKVHRYTPEASERGGIIFNREIIDFPVTVTELTK